MMKTKKKSILLILSMVMVLMVGSIFAYFTDKESKLNKFTIGSVDVSLDEPTFDEDATHNVKPGEEVTKDPEIKNLKDDAYIFAKVTVPYGTNINVMEGGAKTEKPTLDLFKFETTDDWVEVSSSVAADSKSKTYVYAYVDAGTPTECKVMTKAATETTGVKLFKNDKVTFANIVDTAEIADTTLNINVEVYAIQTGLEGDTKEPSAVWTIVENHFKN